MTDAFQTLVKAALQSNPTVDPDKAIMDALLDFTSYKEMTPGEPNPFDDPYVGAALFDGHQRLIGAYRKKSPGERHSEPEAILSALAAIDSKEAQLLYQDIDGQYQKKVWLEGGQKQTRFEEAFATAGDLLRRHHKSETLILYSTLEPCGLYEAQPSCANIISATRIAKVIYGSDDINPKGFGRPVLERAGVRVIGNTSVDKAIRMNNLFFAVADICNRTYSNYDGRRFFAGPPYAIFRRDLELFDHFIPKGESRLKLRSRVPIEVSYVGPETQRIASITTQAEVSHLSQRNYDPDLVFFYGGDSFAELSKLLHYESRTRLALPGTLIFTRDPFLTADTPRLRQISAILSEKAIIRKNAFRKQDELWEAVRLVVLSDFRSELREHFAVVVKCQLPEEYTEHTTSADVAPYATRYVDTAEAVEFVREYTSLCAESDGYVARIIVLAPPRARDKIETFLEAVRPELSADGPLSRTSLQVRIVAVPGSEQQAEYATSEFRTFQARYRHMSRLDVQQPLSASPGLDLTVFAHDVIAGLRDPKFFDPDYLDRLARSSIWTDRRNAGAIYARLTAASGDYAERTFLTRLNEIAEEGLQDSNWAESCSRLNALRDAATRVPEDFAVAADAALQGLAKALHRSLDAVESNPWTLDVMWRWLACWFSYIDSDNHNAPPREYESALGTHIACDPFLLSEAVQYCYREDSDQSRERLNRLLAGAVDRTAVHACAVRLARLSSAEHSSHELNPLQLPRLKSWIRIIKKMGGLPEFEAEYRRCQAALKNGVVEFGRMLAEGEGDLWHEPDTQTDAANMLRSYVGRRAISRLSTDTTESQRLLQDSDLAEHIKSWRADYRVVIEDLLTFVPTNRVAWFLTQLAADSDVSVRWAAVSNAFNSQVSTTACRVEYGSSSDAVQRELRAKVVENARQYSPHYWIEREVLWAFLSAHQVDSVDNSNDLPQYSVPSASRLGLDKYLRGALEHLHPELASLTRKLRKYCKRILLILPPVEWPTQGEAIDAARTGGSPPLGLGQIATSLAADGHYVEVIDAHRYALTATEVAEHAKQFDFVGISVVFSTFNSTQYFLKILGRLSPDLRPRVVLGGHGPTLNEGAFLASQAIFNYLVIGPGEQPFRQLVRGVPVATIAGLRDISAMNESKLYSRTPRALIEDAGRDYASMWARQPVLDRSVFRTPTQGFRGLGAAYEPARTRNSKHVEAHVVTSRGCDWACSFCTEALVNGKSEIRRPVSAVISEVRYLMNLRNVDRIQFIDDNLLPPIAVPGLPPQDIDSRTSWSRDFLSDMTRLRGRSSDRMAWRGLMRLEDYIAYDATFADFPAALADSGCNLLAFGIEYGNEDSRAAAKAGGDSSPSNSEIEAILEHLHHVGIQSKGYFMIGGPHDSPEGANETIDFAVSSGLDLAYFAIFKDFRAMASAKTSLRSDPPGFRLFDFDLGTFVLNTDDSESWTTAFGRTHGSSERDEFRRVFGRLVKLGFKFSDLFKYNDYHLAVTDDTGPTFAPHEKSVDGSYFQTLRRAYLAFYGRADWVSTYEKLIDAGY